MIPEHPIRVRLIKLETELRNRHMRADAQGMTNRAQGQYDALEMLRNAIDMMDRLGLFEPE